MQTNDYSILNAREAQLVALARMGQTDELVEYVYSEMRVQAARLVRGFREAYGVNLDAEDVAMEAVVWLLRGEKLQRALSQSDNPIAWMLADAKPRMLHYCQEERCLIRVPAASQWRGKAVPRVCSLHAPLPGSEDLTLLDVLPAPAVVPTREVSRTCSECGGRLGGNVKQMTCSKACRSRRQRRLQKTK
jgi:hypothetical protein